MARSQETALLPADNASFCHRELLSMLLNISALRKTLAKPN